MSIQSAHISTHACAGTFAAITAGLIAEAAQAKKDAYAAEDRAFFAGQTIRRGVIDLKMDACAIPGEPAYTTFKATTLKDGVLKEFDVAFIGLRSHDIWSSKVYESMDLERQVRRARGDATFRDISRPLIVEGFWKATTRFDDDGKPAKAWLFYASNWHFQMPNGSFVEEGAKPQD